MTEVCRLDYICAGGNRHPSAADWDHSGGGILAFGSATNVALWRPLNGAHRGVFSLLKGHTDLVNVVKFLPSLPNANLPIILSGSVDKTIRVWRQDKKSPDCYYEASVLIKHEAAVNCVAVLDASGIFVSGSADGCLLVWRLAVDDTSPAIEHHVLRSIKLTAGLLPLALALCRLPDEQSASLLAVSGTRNFVQIYKLHDESDKVVLVASLSGHEGWIRSLAFTTSDQQGCSDVILASASQDRYVRLWRIHQGAELPGPNCAAQSSIVDVLSRSLSNKAHRFQFRQKQYSVTFEALLYGHEDWIFAVQWHKMNGQLKLLTASADNSLAIWEADAASGIWLNTARVGEISSQKGSTTATGSTGGFWTGLWSADGNAIASLGRTGSWRLWRSEENNRWRQGFAVSGHVKEVRSLTWSPDGSYLLSLGEDQTTRMHAEWISDAPCSWHEMSRPQIHGYDLRCIAAISDTRFVSGADEKLLRVFEEPASVAVLTAQLSASKGRTQPNLPDAATIPVLGLSNKAVEVVEEGLSTAAGRRDSNDESSESSAMMQKASLRLDHPPHEDHLARHTLWPELEKLYGHGYEISCCAVSYGGDLIASACRASSLDHAVIHLVTIAEWQQTQVLKAHSLTVTNLAFSPDDAYLLSVGRDRQWTLFRRSQMGFEQHRNNPKGHSRMILDCSWAPILGNEAIKTRLFATAGRDKTIKIWRFLEDDVHCVATLTTTAPVTACSFLPRIYHDRVYLAYGLEDGKLFVQVFEASDVAKLTAILIPEGLAPSKAVTRLQWRPIVANIESANGSSHIHFNMPLQLAVASDDTSVRIIRIPSLG